MYQLRFSYGGHYISRKRKRVLARSIGNQDDDMKGKWKPSGSTERSKSCYGQFNWLHPRALTKLVRVAQWVKALRLNQKDLDSNPAKRSAGLRHPISLRGFWWPFSRNNSKRSDWGCPVDGSPKLPQSDSRYKNLKENTRDFDTNKLEVRVDVMASLNKAWSNDTIKVLNCVWGNIVNTNSWKSLFGKNNVIT